MSASTLREAAEKLREITQHVTMRESWRVGEDAPCRCCSALIGPGLHAKWCDSIDAEYIVTMSPPLALALAEWLDATAAWYAADSRGVPVSDLETFESDWFFEDPALAVAETVLGPRA